MKDKDPTAPAAPLDLTKPYESETELQAHYEVVFNRDLFPYESDELLIRRLAASNRLLRRTPELHDQIHSALAADDDASLISLALHLRHMKRS